MAPDLEDGSGTILERLQRRLPSWEKQHARLS
jgi:hypothetical protein